MEGGGWGIGELEGRLRGMEWGGEVEYGGMMEMGDFMLENDDGEGLMM